MKTILTAASRSKGLTTVFKSALFSRSIKYSFLQTNHAALSPNLTKPARLFSTGPLTPSILMNAEENNRLLNIPLQARTPEKILLAEPITVVLDIDGTLAVGYETFEELNKHVNVTYFKERGLLVEALRPHCIHPAAPALLQALLAEPKIEVVFFSSGDDKRNELLVKEMLRLAVGKQPEMPIKLYSRSHLRNMEYEKQDYPSYARNFYGQKKKDLTKVVAEDRLPWTVLIDDDYSYSVPTQVLNMLKIPALDPWHYRKEIYKPTFEHEMMVRYNNLYYAMGLLLTACETMQADKSTLQDALFKLQYSQLKPQLGDKKLSECYYLSIFNKKYYDRGLAYLKQYNSGLEFCLQSEMANFADEKSTQKVVNNRKCA